MTQATLKVLAAFLHHDPKRLAGYDLINETKVMSGALYPILKKLEKANWIEGEWEQDYEPHEVKRPKRKHYVLTDLGRERARVELSKRRSDIERSWQDMFPNVLKFRHLIRLLFRPV